MRSKLLRALEFLQVPLEGGKPHLVLAPGGHCMYGFTDGEGKAGHVLFVSLLVIEGAQLMADALLAAGQKGVRGCEAYTEEDDRPRTTRPIGEVR